MTTSYFLEGDRVVKETNGSDTLWFYYDASGSVISFELNGTAYFYVKNLQGDITGILNSNGTLVVEYSYDSWGKLMDITGSGAATVGIKNPYRYRGYRYDTETELYYLNQRYYDSNIKCVISCDTVNVVGLSFGVGIDKNLFSYCNNNPVMRVDYNGAFWETIYDVITLGASIVEVCSNPTDPLAWAGLVGDTIDLIPFISGVGEATRGKNTTIKVIGKGEDVVDAARTIYKTADVASDIRVATGSYEILFEIGKNYVGKRGFKRAMDSARRYSDDVVSSIMWKSAPNARQAFIDEFMMQMERGVLSSNIDAYTYNKIWSPGKGLLGR